jgi:hypothetical protein
MIIRKSKCGHACSMSSIVDTCWFPPHQLLLCTFSCLPRKLCYTDVNSVHRSRHSLQSTSLGMQNSSRRRINKVQKNSESINLSCIRVDSELYLVDELL